MKTVSTTLLLCALFPAMAFGQETKEPGAPPDQAEEQDYLMRHFLGSSLFLLFNFTEDSADFYQLTYGHQFTPRDALIVEAITWKYSEPLGTYGDSEEKYPGKIRSYGVGMGYQRFVWKKAYSTIQATPFLQQFYDEDDQKVQKGFQLYCQLILGYRFEFLKRRLYVEPAYALKYWPVNTNFPDAFAEVEEGAPNHTFEPSLHFGVRF